MSAHADSSSRYMWNNMLAYLSSVYCAVFPLRTGTDTWTTVNDAVLHACHSLQQSSRDGAAKTLYPNAANSVGIDPDREPVCWNF